MSRNPEPDYGQELPKLQGHTIGVVDSPASCEPIVEALQATGIDSSRVLIFEGDDGIQLIDRMMVGSLWGESAEVFLKQARAELEDGHAIISVRVADANEASMIATVATQFTGRSFYHFGELVDTRLTR